MIQKIETKHSGRIAKLMRDRAFLSTVILVLVAFATAAAATLAVDDLVVLTGADRFVQDWEVASLSPSEPQNRDIVIVAIKESTLQQFPYRSPVDRAFLARLLATLAARHPRAIGIDYLFDQPTEAGKDGQLRRVMTGLPVPVVVAYSNSPEIVTPEQSSYLDRFVPVRLRGNVTLPEDQSDTVRFIFSGARDNQGHFIPGFARAVAAAAGKPTAPLATPIVWRGQPSDGSPAFREYPAQATGLLPASWFAGKIILVGADLSLREDRHRTPFAAILPGGEGTLPGIAIHANAIAQLLESRTPPQLSSNKEFLIVFACAIAGGILGVLQLHILLRVAAGVFFLVLLWAAGAALYHIAGVMIGLLTPSLAFATSFSALDSLAGREARRQRQFIQGAFSRYVSPKVVEELIRDPSRMSLQGERRMMTYLFTDVENFTTFSERLDSHELAPLLNDYFDGVTQVVLRYKGMVDKFIGDAVFAIFNAPVDLPDHAERAVRCALEIDTFAEAFRKQRAGGNAPFGATRIGIHTGTALIGNFGSTAHFNYTAQGDAVNIASRLEALNKHFGTRICVSGETRNACTTIAFRPIGSVVLKGKSSAVEVWEPLHMDAWTSAYLDNYRSAYAKLAHAAPDALALFEGLSRESPGDPCVRLHLNRLRRGDTGVAVVMDAK